MTIDELKRIADEFLTKHYGMTLDIPIVRNNRLKVHMGRFIGWRCEDDEELSYTIEIAGFMFEYATDAVIVDTLLHECIHYALCSRGEPYYDGHPHFEAELARHGVGSTETNFVGKFYEFECGSCGETVRSKRKAIADYPEEYSSNCCRADIRYVGERIYDGTEVLA